MSIKKSKSRVGMAKLGEKAKQGSRHFRRRLAKVLRQKEQERKNDQ